MKPGNIVGNICCIFERVLENYEFYIRIVIAFVTDVPNPNMSFLTLEDYTDLMRSRTVIKDNDNSVLRFLSIDPIISGSSFNQTFTLSEGE